MGLIARHAEAAGIPTLCMGSALDILQAVHPPRAAFLDYLLGHTTGKPSEPELQRAILLEAFEAFSSLSQPGQIKHLPFRWAEDDGWKDGVMNDGDTRTPRRDTPQYQTEADRILAEQNDPEACEVCETAA